MSTVAGFPLWQSSYFVWWFVDKGDCTENNYDWCCVISLMYLWFILFHVFSWNIMFVSGIMNQHGKLGEIPRQRLETVLWWMTSEKTFLTCWRNTEPKTLRSAKTNLSCHSTIFKHLQTISNYVHVRQTNSQSWEHHCGPPPTYTKIQEHWDLRREHLSTGWYSGGCDIHSSFFGTGSTNRL